MSGADCAFVCSYGALQSFWTTSSSSLQRYPQGYRCQQLVVNLHILLEHAVHLRYVFEHIIFSPSCLKQLSASPQEGNAWKDARSVRELA